MEIEEVKTAHSLVAKIEHLVGVQESLGDGGKTHFEFRIGGEYIANRDVRPRLYAMYIHLAIVEVQYELRALRQQLKDL